jgi:ABC-type transporter Mla subunit MlaD
MSNIETILPKQNDTTSIYVDEDVGLFDEMERSSTAMEEQARLIAAYGEETNRLTAKIQNISEKYNGNVENNKDKFDAMGLALKESGKTLLDIANMSDSNFQKSSDAFDNVLLLIEEIDDDGRLAISSLIETIVQTQAQIQQFLDATREARAATLRAPRATKQFNKGKRDAVEAFDKMISVSEMQVNRFGEYINYLRSFS